ncbi:MAG: beta-ketoacyl synthase [Gammaproteobacteria bacterium]|nr:beta-ketoacyl synthase [Gammaproteobacteria bacterium]MBT5204224.1 beta-ketoacyl synthase [Gammaproteobacteria bacterium]MBT5602917.1 beta-ketoacyl synthase [Gammaproteobacteria bacterium]
MTRLPVIVGFGGINPAGRSSGHHAYRRTVFDKLPASKSQETLKALAVLMNCPVDETHILNHTLIRKLETNLFDPADIRLNKSAQMDPVENEAIEFTMKRSHLPARIPPDWEVSDTGEGGQVIIRSQQPLDVLFPDRRQSKVNSAGQLPSGFDPESLYQSRNHPRGLQLTVYGASDAIQSLGIPWQAVKDKVPADQFSVYASSAMGQLDNNGSGAMLQSTMMGKRVSSKNCALGLAQMTADFVNAYVIGSVGSTGANVGACATFLYNLRQGIQDIRSGKYRVVIVGSSEAPLTPEVIEGYRTMGALAEDDALARLGPLNHQLACRPFGDNCGFTLAEASQFLVLFDDELAMELGAHIYGSVADVFINADGFKKSIPGPGIGNYITVGKAMATIKAILGEENLKHNTYMQAHGTGTPQNRVTESHIFNELAKAYGMKDWPVTAIKAYLGHSLSCASADQIISSLGVWQDGIIPGIQTTPALAEDVHHSHLDFLLKHTEINPSTMAATLINSKGFGGNNATAAILSPTVTESMLLKRYGKKRFMEYQQTHQGVDAATRAYEEQTIAGNTELIYQFGQGVVEGSELAIEADHISIPGQQKKIDLTATNPYADMT